ncbi:fasciclin domain-containing protein [Chitinophaga barathri]|uniref:Fasciclin domain-containing protein n=1 Tax=Chitinophaga barathri TaxID=1647451 RepID=A0A3N4MFF4_9BACT|nr:fasciclin domain-containing protein [Chitinophaga barathri]RPD42135.1 fasciclin domain-containing protein [Chitinophaga barathri]
MTIYKHTLMLCLLLFCAAACTRKTELLSNRPQPVMQDYLATQPELSLFGKALKKAGLDKDIRLQSGGPFTFFVPVDSAMIRAGFTEQVINNYDADKLAKILRYHILNGRLSSTTLVGNYTQDAFSLEPGRLPKVSRNFHGIFLNGITVTTPNVELGDGVLHKMNGISLLPGLDAYDLLQQHPDLTFMAYFVRHTDGWEERLREPDTLRWKGNGLERGFTFLAPTDEAFREEGYNTPEELMQEDPVYVRNLLGFYLIGGRWFISDWLDGVELSGYRRPALYALSTNPMGYFIQAGGLTFKTHYNLNVPRIIHSDIMADNGVLHIVDKVIKAGI